VTETRHIDREDFIRLRFDLRRDRQAPPTSDPVDPERKLETLLRRIARPTRRR
jgi:hypothetical protein